MLAPSITDVRIQAHLTENGTWRVRITAQVRGQFREEFHPDVEILQTSIGQLVAGFFRRHGEIEQEGAS